MVLTLPTVHLNGSSSETLLTLNRTVLDALRHVIEALNAAAPNGRDYYPQGDDALKKAADEHIERVAKLEEVREEIYAIVEHLIIQEGERKR